MNTRELQSTLGVAADGIIGPRTLAALAAARYDVILDPGHTADHAREHPAAWPAGYWGREPGSRVAAALGFTAATADSVEHILNVALAREAEQALAAAGLSVLVYDEPGDANNAEINTICRLVNGAKPRAFVSIHANASRGIATSGSNTACGSIAYYPAGRASSAALARALASSLIACRTRLGGPHNRADATAAGSYAVLTRAAASIPAALVEVGFYDHDADLAWMAAHLPDLGRALASGITATLAA